MGCNQMINNGMRCDSHNEYFGDCGLFRIDGGQWVPSISPFRGAACTVGAFQFFDPEK